ncbi:hypothetical protein [Devosia sp.]|uniref:hypothetical protein n=1 Tax=Devosia sp. TaxID=1871048 RepID=UPI0029304E35|nr:hypothetical protein [Devosia sp.]
MGASKRQYTRGGKLSDETVQGLLICFVNGITLAQTAEATGLSRKTVKLVFIDLRSRLKKPAFNPWHQSNDPWPEQRKAQGDASDHFWLSVSLATCDSSRCRRNFQLKNVARRKCRGCVLNDRSPGAIEHYLSLIDRTHDFYEQLGWRNDTDHPNIVARFELRAAHFLTVWAVASHSRRLSNDLCDPADLGFLSGGSLFVRFHEELIANPLSHTA